MNGEDQEVLKGSFETQVVFESSSPLQGDIAARQMEIEIIFHFGVAADQISNLYLLSCNIFTLGRHTDAQAWQDSSINFTTRRMNRLKGVGGYVYV